MQTLGRGNPLVLYSAGEFYSTGHEMVWYYLHPNPQLDKQGVECLLTARLALAYPAVVPVPGSEGFLQIVVSFFQHQHGKFGRITLTDGRCSIAYAKEIRNIGCRVERSLVDGVPEVDSLRRIGP